MTNIDEFRAENQEQVKEIDRLLNRIKELDKQIEASCEEWAADDTALKNLAAKHGIDTEGSSYYVPDMVTCIEEMEEKLVKRIAELEKNL